jgi:molybdate transport system substrate-binding protein
MRKLLFLLGLALAWLLEMTSARAQESRLTVFAAASLTDAFESIGEAFEAANPGVEILFSFASSSTLAAQLAQGAPADIYASANERQMDVVVENGRTAGVPRAFAHNCLTLIVPADNPANIQAVRDLANPGVNLVIAAPETPIRTYTDMMLEAMAVHPAYGGDFRRAVLGNVVSEEPNVRLVAAKVALGEADAGVVYRSDVTPDISDDVLMLLIPDAFNQLATYPIAVTNDTDKPELANSFVEFVLSDVGQDILVEWNLISVRMPPVSDVVQIPADGTLSVDGQVLNPLSLTTDALRSDYSLQTIVTTCLEGDSLFTTSYTGVLVWDIIRAAQPNPGVHSADDQLSSYLVVTSVEGDQVVVSWGEIDPHLGNQPIMVGFPTDANQEDLWLVVPSDSGCGRYLPGVANISVRDAPPPGNN